MSNTENLKIAIAGGGTAGWMAAALFARFLGATAEITLVESDAIGTVGVGEATIPQIHNLIIGLGLDQAEFMRATNASFKLGIEFVDWLREGHSYIHSFGTTGRPVGLIPFRQLWLRGRALGVAEDFGAYSVNIAAARQQRFSLASLKSVPDLAYAYHFDAALLAKLLRSYSEARGVKRIEGKIERFERDGASGDITALTLEGEREIHAELFIDCTGFASLALGQALDVPFVDWSQWLPCDTALAVPTEGGEQLRPYTQSMARPAGWQWRIPLQHRTGNGHVFCSSFMEVEEATQLLLDTLETEPLADPRPIRFRTGHRKEFWSHNCVGLGLAAGFMEPLESTSIHLVQSGIARLLNLLPGDRHNLSQARQTFNRQSTVEWERIRDFLVLHYIANEREGDAFWDHCRAMTPPDTLREKLEMFSNSGQFVREDDELFLDDSWAQVMLGQGIEPRSWSPLADNVPGEDVGPFLAALEKQATTIAAALPTHREFLTGLVGRAPETA
ncbi:tryptophan halogenase family protein [Qipengyuania vesicularis]|uniref:tryptophan halogenase family protein n=1 Tax=Qipengyuania vesicularis TaxID=2867232 RepID=UPI001C86EE2E|nr:tryptophan halogenase family protein [Qipengyuania vesicularis]MBX7527426.1 tryptophan 7-halogenase [Qipengyuania vesicularis]